MEVHPSIWIEWLVIPLSFAAGYWAFKVERTLTEIKTILKAQSDFQNRIRTLETWKASVERKINGRDS